MPTADVCSELARALIIIALCSPGGALAAEPRPADKSIKMDAPMAGKMRKPGMKQGDVKKSAEKKERVMKPKLEKEEKEMARSPK